MELDIRINKDSLAIPISNPYHLDLEGIVSQIAGFAASRTISVDGLDLHGLLPRMVRGVAGCESGCPANARELVSQGFKNFTLAYVEGGILTAEASVGNGNVLAFKLFPDF